VSIAVCLGEKRDSLSSVSRESCPRTVDTASNPYVISRRPLNPLIIIKAIVEASIGDTDHCHTPATIPPGSSGWSHLDGRLPQLCSLCPMQLLKIAAVIVTLAQLHIYELEV